MPIVYSNGYNISVYGLESFHPFDSQKYGRVVDFLTTWGVVTRNELIAPEMPDEEFLKAHLCPDYLKSLDERASVARYTEMPALGLLPMWTIRRCVLRPMLLATGGTLEAARRAVGHGWAINLSGGYHHASLDRGGGFCIYPDITLAVRAIRAENAAVVKIMIIDLDAHQGDGYARDLGDDPDTFIFDMYNPDIYPQDDAAAQGIDHYEHVRHGVGDEEYLEKLGNGLAESFRRFTPDLVIYNAGTDILAADPLGGMNVSEGGVAARDEAVFRAAFENRAKIVMLLSGGYQKSNAETIARSIENLFEKFDLRRMVRAPEDGR